MFFFLLVSRDRVFFYSFIYFFFNRTAFTSVHPQQQHHHHRLTQMCVFIVAWAVQSAALAHFVLFIFFAPSMPARFYTLLARLFTTHCNPHVAFTYGLLPGRSRLKALILLIVSPLKKKNKKITAIHRDSKWSWSGSTCFDSSGRMRGRCCRHPPPSPL